jgi:hypothetical protein
MKLYRKPTFEKKALLSEVTAQVVCNVSPFFSPCIL